MKRDQYKNYNEHFCQLIQQEVHKMLNHIRSHVKACAQQLQNDSKPCFFQEEGLELDVQSFP